MRLRPTQVMGDDTSTAQVHPEKLTKAFMEEAGRAGAKVQHGTVTGIKLSQDSTPRVEGEVPCPTPLAWQPGPNLPELRCMSQR